MDSGTLFIPQALSYHHELVADRLSTCHDRRRRDDQRPFRPGKRNVSPGFGDGSLLSHEQEQRYAREFVRETSRFIYCRVDVQSKLWQTRDRSYSFVWKYINPDDSLRGEVSLPFTVRKEWRTAWVSHSWGWDNPGNWPPGDYRVVVLLDGRPFGEGAFTIR